MCNVSMEFLDNIRQHEKRDLHIIFEYWSNRTLCIEGIVAEALIWRDVWRVAQDIILSLQRRILVVVSVQVRKFAQSLVGVAPMTISWWRERFLSRLAGNIPIDSDIQSMTWCRRIEEGSCIKWNPLQLTRIRIYHSLVEAVCKLDGSGL